MDRERWALRLVALVLVITLLTPDIGAPPSDDTPVTCTQDDLSEALRRFESTIKAQKAIIVVGAEGSGSKLAALAAAQALEGAAFRSPSIPPPYDPSCAESRGVWKTWDGHGIHANFCAASAVIHRSLPHTNCFPDVRRLVRELKDDYRFDEVLVVVAARDPSSTLRTKARHHQRNGGVAAREQRLAFDFLRGLVHDPPCRVFVWSYEAFLVLGDAYSKQLLDALKLPRPLASEPAPELPLPTYDGNRAYARRRRPWELLRAAALSIVAPRAPAYVAGARAELR
jgi:hypothetical protein